MMLLAITRRRPVTRAPPTGSGTTRQTHGRSRMPGKAGDKGNKAVNALAGGAAAYVTRKVIVFTWTKVTGRQPPDKAEDREVAFGEAVAWAVLLAATVAAARVGAPRFVRSRRGRPPRQPR